MSADDNKTEKKKTAFKGINRPYAGPRSDLYKPDTPLPRGENRLQLHSLGTPNGQKVTIFLEELGVGYDAYCVNIMKGQQFTSGFVDVNPNSKIPALVDTGAQSSDGKTVDRHVFESTSILVYLAETFDSENKYLPTDPALRTEVFNWLFFQHGAAPYFGQFGHFYKYAPEKIQYGIDRYSMEAKRLLDVLDQRLEGREYLVGDSITIADIATWPWVRCLIEGYNAAEYLDIASYEFLNQWMDRLGARQAFKDGRLVNKFWYIEGQGNIVEKHKNDAGEVTSVILAQPPTSS